MLDVSGVAHLFGGEAALVEEVEARLTRQGLTIALGLADAPRAAFALARYSSARIAPAGLSGKAFAKLYHEMPVAALGLDDKTNADMARAGLTSHRRSRAAAARADRRALRRRKRSPGSTR